MKKGLTGNLIEFNLAMLFISTSGVLGRYIELPSSITIAFRALLAGVILFLFCKAKKFNLRIAKKDRLTVLTGGILMGIHWVTYFYSLRLSNVAIGMLSLFTYPAITAVLEPIILKTKILKFHLVLSLLVLVGIYFLVPDFDIESDNLKAVGFGVFSALCYAIRNILMKSKISSYSGSVLMMYQMIIIAIMLCPAYFMFDTYDITEFLPSILLLAILTTVIGHTLFVYSLNNFSTVTASIMGCAQPMYGVIMGIFFLNEYPEKSTIIGGAIIIFTVFMESYRVSKNK